MYVVGLYWVLSVNKRKFFFLLSNKTYNKSGSFEFKLIQFLTILRPSLIYVQKERFHVNSYFLPFPSLIKNCLQLSNLTDSVTLCPSLSNGNSDYLDLGLPDPSFGPRWWIIFTLDRVEWMGEIHSRRRG